eukprot:scaffold1583_cov299-Pinguiococcus_pyrenoidosus.AAC.5
MEFEASPASPHSMGLSANQFVAWLALVAIRCTWFETQCGGTWAAADQAIGLLQCMDESGGKGRTAATLTTLSGEPPATHHYATHGAERVIQDRGSRILPSFDFSDTFSGTASSTSRRFV